MAEFVEPLAVLNKEWGEVTMAVGEKAMDNADEVGAASVDYLMYSAISLLLTSGRRWRKLPSVGWPMVTTTRSMKDQNGTFCSGCCREPPVTAGNAGQCDALMDAEDELAEPDRGMFVTKTSLWLRFFELFVEPLVDQLVDNRGVASVEVSPRFSSSLAATLRRMRRIILPERVLGSPGAH